MDGIKGFNQSNDMISITEKESTPILLNIVSLLTLTPSARIFEDIKLHNSELINFKSAVGFIFKILKKILRFFKLIICLSYKNS